ncbi:MAG: rod shape-determining protein RodA [Desulfobacterales bacterium]
MFDRRLLENFNWGLLGLTFIFAGVGVATVYSAVTASPDTFQSNLYLKQATWYLAGLSAMIPCMILNYRLLERWAYVLYTACIGLLIWVLYFGRFAGGSRRWIDLGVFSLQPSELIKIALIIVLSQYFARRARIAGLTIRDLAWPFMLVGVPFLLIVKQPDLGTALLLVLVAGTMTAFAKIEKRSLICLAASGLVFVPMIWFFLKEYQKQRILTFLNPDRDPLGAGYHIIQSKIAIGSGMLHGKGFLEGTQNALAFLPEQHTDFIFSVLAEEWGFIGSTGLLSMFILLLVVCLSIAHSCREPFGVYLSVGITALIFWEVLINIGMVMGLMPVVGIPLPFISYGGSSIVAKMICVGLLLGVSMRRYMKP